MRAKVWASAEPIALLARSEEAQMEASRRCRGEEEGRVEMDVLTNLSHRCDAHAAVVGLACSTWISRPFARWIYAGSMHKRE